MGTGGGIGLSAICRVAGVATMFRSAPPGFLMGTGGGIGLSAICRVTGVAVVFRSAPPGFLMGTGGGIGLSAICKATGVTIPFRSAPPGFLIGTGGGMGLSAWSTCFDDESPTGVKLVKQSESPQRERAEIVRMFLVVMCFSIRKMESREQRNSVRQASRKHGGGAASARTCLVLQPDEKAFRNKPSERNKRKRSNAEERKTKKDNRREGTGE
jgi:hypothetical protein